MLGSGIILSNNPRGRFLEGTVSGTPKPGTVMQVSAGVEPTGGRLQWEVYNKSGDGVAALIAVLLPDDDQGQLATTAYVSGTRCFLYCPVAGEELNMLVSAPGTGTGDNFAIGDVLMVDDGTGTLVADSSGPSKPFFVMETVDDVVSAGSLVHCMYTGH